MTSEVKHENRKNMIDNGESNAVKRDNVVKEDESNTFDYLLETIVGGGGWGQWLVLIAQLPIGIVCGLSLFMQFFVTYEPKHRCFLPNCDEHFDGLNGIHNSSLEHIVPKRYVSNDMFREDERLDQCRMFKAINNNTCSVSSFDNSSVTKCNMFLYDTSQFIETLVTRMDLVCDDEYRQNFLGTNMMLGLFIGALIGGWVSDKFGRKFALIGALVILTPTVTFGGFFPNYTIYVVLRLIAVSCLAVIWISGDTLTLELFGKEYRSAVVITRGFVSTIAQLILTAVAYFVRHWMYIHLWTGVACLLTFPCLFFIPESARWLNINGKIKQAERVLMTIGKRNGKSLTESQQEKVRNTLIQIEKNARKTKGHEDLTPLDLVRSPHLTKTIILVLNWITIFVGPYILSLIPVKINDDLFLNNMMIVIFGEIPGMITLLVTLKYFGRRVNLFYTQVILGVCCVTLAFLHQSHNIAITTFFLIGKCFAGAAFLMVWLITAESYPTNLRSQAVGTCFAIASVFGLITRFSIESPWMWLTMFMPGVLSLFTASWLYVIPETKHTELIATMKDADELENKKNKTKLHLEALYDEQIEINTYRPHLDALYCPINGVPIMI